MIELIASNRKQILRDDLADNDYLVFPVKTGEKNTIELALKRSECGINRLTLRMKRNFDDVGKLPSIIKLWEVDMAMNSSVNICDLLCFGSLDGNQDIFVNISENGGLVFFLKNGIHIHYHDVHTQIKFTYNKDNKFDDGPNTAGMTLRNADTYPDYDIKALYQILKEFGCKDKE